MTSSTTSLPLPALIIIAVVGLFLAAMLQSIEVAFSRMSIARATDLVEEERQNASAPVSYKHLTLPTKLEV